MFALAYKYLVKTKVPDIQSILDIFTKAAIEVCEGQQYDMNYETNDNVSIPEYIEMIRLKTAILIATSLRTGAVVAGADKTDVENIYLFGENVGIAFQLMDDLLDVYGNQEVFGKKIGGDIVTNKKTYLLIKAMNEAKDKDLAELKKYFSSTNFNDEEKIKSVTEIYNKLGVKESTNQLINDYYDKALMCLSKISINDDKKAVLKKYSDQLVTRDF